MPPSLLISNILQPVPISLVRKLINISFSSSTRTSKAPPHTPKPSQQNDSQTQEQAQAAAEINSQAGAPETTHSPLTTWAYQTQNSHLTIYEKLEKDKWECGGDNNDNNNNRS